MTKGDKGGFGPGSGDGTDGREAIRITLALIECSGLAAGQTQHEFTHTVGSQPVAEEKR